MKYCQNCNKKIEKNEKLYKNLCFECYVKYLLEKIDNMSENNDNVENPPKKHFSFFKKRKK